MTDSKSILDGVGSLVDEWFQFDFKATRPLYKHKTAALELSKRQDIPSAESFLRSAYSKIDSNWLLAVAEKRHSLSSENWRFVPHPTISMQNKSAEVRLERAIIQAGHDDWVNQVPTSSGLTGPASDKTRNVDLVCRRSDHHFELIELKVASNNPLFAAIEILLYGLLLAWSRNNQSKLSYDPIKQPVLQAKSVTLCVLAPPEYYEGYNLAHLSEVLNSGLASCQDILGIHRDFQFTQFPHRPNLDDTPEQLLEQAINRKPIWWSVESEA